MTTGERMKERRKALGISAEYVAEKLGVSPATIYRYEKGDIEKMPGNILEPIARVLCTSPSYLMGWSEEPCAPLPIPSDTLTPAEHELIADYRELTPPGQEYIRQTMAMAKMSYSEESNSSSNMEEAE